MLDGQLESGDAHSHAELRSEVTLASGVRLGADPASLLEQEVGVTFFSLVMSFDRLVFCSFVLGEKGFPSLFLFSEFFDPYPE